MSLLRSLYRRHSLLLSCLLIGGIALGLRAWGAGWSLPYVDHPDEPAVVNVVLRIVQGQVDPDFFFYPSLMLYLQAALFKLHFWWGLRTGIYQAPLILPTTTDFYTVIPQAFVWGRLLTAVLGAATVVALVIAGGRYFGWRQGLLAGLLLALSPWAITHAHYVAVDVPAACTATLALLATLPVLRRGSWRDYLLAGVLLGLATATKYQSVLVVAALLVAHVLRWRGRSLSQIGRLIAAGCLAAVAFLLLSPYTLLNYAGFRRDIGTLFGSYEFSHGDVVGRWPLVQYAWFLLREGLGPLPAICALVGLAVLARRDRPTLLVVLAFPLLLTLVLLRPTTHFYRNLLPIQPALLLLAAVGAVGLWDLARSRLPHALRLPSAALAVIALCLPSAAAALATGAGLARPDSRVAAQEMARRDFPGVRVASELSHALLWNGLAQSTHIHYLPERDLAWYREQGYGLLLASSTTRRSYDWTPDYQRLIGAGRVVATYGGPGSSYRGPRIDVVDTGLAVVDASLASSPQGGPTTGGAASSLADRTEFGPLVLLHTAVGHLVEGDNGQELLPTTQLAPGDILGVLTSWTVRRPAPAAGYTLFLHLRDSNGQNLTQRDAPPWQGLFPPRTWRPGLPVVDRLDLQIPPNVPPGTYQLVLGLYDSASQQRFPVHSGDSRLPGDELTVATILVQ